MRRFSFLMLAVCLTFSVAGCDGGAATSTKEEPAATTPAESEGSGAEGSAAKPAEGSAEETEGATPE